MNDSGYRPDGRRTLFIHPEESQRSVVARLFRDENRSWAFASNGREGLELAAEWKPDLIYIYWRVPSQESHYPMNAPAFVKALRKRPTLSSVPVALYCMWTPMIARLFPVLKHLGVCGIIQQPFLCEQVMELHELFHHGGNRFPDDKELNEMTVREQEVIKDLEPGPSGRTVYDFLSGIVGNAMNSGEIDREWEA